MLGQAPSALWRKRGSMREQGAEGADGNARLTAAVGLVLLVVLFVEGITVLQVRSLITLHIFVGLLLIPPTALKVATTSYRFARYYSHSPSYVRHGPPPPLLRWTAPLLIIFTVALLASGVALVVVGSQGRGMLLTAHQVSFALWFALMALHVLGHVKDALVLSRWDWWPRADHSRPRGKGQRRGLVMISLIAGLALGAAVLPAATAWTNRQNFGGHDRHQGSAPIGHPAVHVQESSWP